MKRIALFLSIVMAACTTAFLNQCAAQQLNTTQARGISKTTVEILYDESTTVWWPGDTYPITLICQLRDGGGQIVATQEITWTVTVADEYTSDPVVQPISLTWSFAEPLEPGWYEEFCMAEVDGHYGRSDTEQDGNYYKANEWRAPCIYGLFFKGR